MSFLDDLFANNKPAAMTSEEFGKQALNGSVQVTVPIAEFDAYVNALTDAFKEQGNVDEDFINQNLRGVCPKCGFQYAGKGLVVVSGIKFTMQYARTVSFTNSSVMAQRMVNGGCATEKCKSKEMTLVWGA
ncbi:hypothetical protein KQH62_05825 [bacterium]|nr:hypothetical protein [bacterium]